MKTTRCERWVGVLAAAVCVCCVCVRVCVCVHAPARRINDEVGQKQQHHLCVCVHAPARRINDEVGKSNSTISLVRGRSPSHPDCMPEHAPLQDLDAVICRSTLMDMREEQRGQEDMMS
eukprot:1160739-Pelagomonas_calceolata.AAC.7